MSPTDWLPPLVLFEHFGGDWSRYEQALYQFFRADFVESWPAREGQRVGYRKRPMERGREYTFWHLISRGPDHQSRVPDMRRCERIRWPRPLIQMPPGDRAKAWETRRSGDRRLILAVGDFSYLVVLAMRKGYYLLVTAYWVERKHERRKLQKQHKDFVGDA